MYWNPSKMLQPSSQCCLSCMHLWPLLCGVGQGSLGKPPNAVDVQYGNEGQSEVGLKRWTSEID